MPPEQLLGPLGLLVASLIAVAVLARELKKSWDGRLIAEIGRAERAEAREIVSLDGWKAQSSATEDLTATLTKMLGQQDTGRGRQDEARERQDQARERQDQGRERQDQARNAQDQDRHDRERN